MSYNEIFNRPYFAVPPEAPQVQLLLQRIPQAGAAGWYANGADGTVYFSIAIYFGSLIMHPEDASEREREVRRLLGFAPDSTLRLDYACSRKTTCLLRAGEPGTDPAPFSAFSPEGLAAAESLIGDFLSLDLRTILLDRRVQDTETDDLFRDEEVIYEGFLGDEGLPLTLQRLGDSPFAINNTIMATIL